MMTTTNLISFPSPQVYHRMHVTLSSPLRLSLSHHLSQKSRCLQVKATSDDGNNGNNNGENGGGGGGGGGGDGEVPRKSDGYWVWVPRDLEPEIYFNSGHYTFRFKDYDSYYEYRSNANKAFFCFIGGVIGGVIVIDRILEELNRLIDFENPDMEKEDSRSKNNE